jgi:Skp family chaperone for outer membrane proteins
MSDLTAAERAGGERSPLTPAEDVRTILINRVSWGALFAGIIIALVVQLLLSMLGVGVGVATLNPATGDNADASTFSLAAGIWFLVSGIIASFIGGYFAGRLCGRPVRSTAAMHGLTTWAATTIVIIYLLTTAVGGIVNGFFSGLTGAVGGFGHAVETVAKAAAPQGTNVGDPFAAIEQQLRQATGGNDPKALRDAAVSALKAALTGNKAQAQDARQRAAQAIAKAENISLDEARKRVAQYEQEYDKAVKQAKQQAVEAANTAVKVVSTGALYGFVALVLGAIAAWLGGLLGTVKPVVTDKAVL